MSKYANPTLRRPDFYGHSTSLRTYLNAKVDSGQIAIQFNDEIKKQEAIIASNASALEIMRNKSNATPATISALEAQYAKKDSECREEIARLTKLKEQTEKDSVVYEKSEFDKNFIKAWKDCSDPIGARTCIYYLLQTGLGLSVRGEYVEHLMSCIGRQAKSNKQIANEIAKNQLMPERFDAMTDLNKDRSGNQAWAIIMNELCSDAIRSGAIKAKDIRPEVMALVAMDVLEYDRLQAEKLAKKQAKQAKKNN